MNLKVALVLACSLVVMSCATTKGHGTDAGRDPQSVGAGHYTVPTSEQLFLRAKFLVKKGLALWYEDHYNEELELTTRRPTVDLTGSIFEAKYGKPGTHLQANFYQDGKFYVARIPNEGVKNIYFQLAHFPPEFIAAHSLLRFEMDPARPIELVAEMPTLEQVDAMQGQSGDRILEMLPDMLSGPEYLIRNAAISAEAQWTQNDPKKAYDLKRGQHGAFIQIIRFVSMKSRLEEFWDNGNSVTQIKLDNSKDGDKVLATAFQFSQRDGTSRGYNTGAYNCTTMAFDIYEAATGIKDPRIGYIRAFADRHVPVLAPIKLKQYGGVDAAPMHLDPSLATESLAAYRTAIVEKGKALCGPATSAAYCVNLKSAVAMLQKARPAECHALFGAD